MSSWDNPSEWDWQTFASLGGSNMLGAIGQEDVFGNVAAADAQMQAQQDALAQQERMAQQAQQYFQGRSDMGIGLVDYWGQRGADAISDYMVNALGQNQRGMDASANAMEGYYNRAQNNVSRAYDTSMGQLAGGYNQARSDLGQVADLQRYGAGAAQGYQAYDVAGQASDRLGNMVDRGLYSGFEQDPGYKFRQEQGEKAILQGASARGGRYGADTLKELSEFNQGLASQEYSNFAARRQAEAGVAGSADQQRLSALMNQAGRSDAAAAQANQNQMAFANMGYGAQANLAQMAQQYGQQQAGMTTQFGQQQAGMNTQLGQSLADMYAQAYGQRANMYQGAGSQLGQMYGNMGSNMGNIAIGAGSNNTSLAQNMMGAYQNFAQYGGSVQQAQANQNQSLFGTVMSLVA